MDINARSATAIQHQITPQPLPAQKQPLCVSSTAPETSSSTVVEAEGASVPSIVRENAVKICPRLLSTDGCFAGAREALPRCGSAPSSSATAITGPSGTTTCVPPRGPTKEKPSLLGARTKMDRSTPEPERKLAKTTRSCWDETRDKTSAVTAGDAATLPPRYSSAYTPGSKAATSTASEGRQNEPLPQQPGPCNSSTRSGGLKGLGSGSGKLVGFCLGFCG